MIKSKFVAISFQMSVKFSSRLSNFFTTFPTFTAFDIELNFPPIKLRSMKASKHQKGIITWMEKTNSLHEHSMDIVFHDGSTISIQLSGNANFREFFFKTSFRRARDHSLEQSIYSWQSKYFQSLLPTTWQLQKYLN